MLLVFQKSDSMFDKIVRFIDGGEWSHVSIVIKKNTVIEASAPNNIVRVRALDSLLIDRPEHQIIKLDLPNGELALAVAAIYVGAKYDYLALAGLATGLDIQSRDRYFCTELAVAILEAGGLTADKVAHRMGLNNLLKNAVQEWHGTSITDEEALAWG